MKVVRAKVDRGKAYPLDDALKLVKANGRRQVRRIGRRRRQPGRRREEVRPDGARLGRTARRHGKTMRVAVFAQGDKAKAAQAAGADIVGYDDLATKVKEGFMDFDVVIATPDAMSVVGQLGQILGPRGLMPNPKVGTVTADVITAVKNARAGQVSTARTKAASSNARSAERRLARPLKANLLALIDALNKARPRGLRAST